MAGLPDAGNIGQDRGTQDPQDAIKQEEGVYEDAVDGLSEDDRYQSGIMPKGADPMPIKG